MLWIHVWIAGNNIPLSNLQSLFRSSSFLVPSPFLHLADKYTTFHRSLPIWHMDAYSTKGSFCSFLLALVHMTSQSYHSPQHISIVLRSFHIHKRSQDILFCAHGSSSFLNQIIYAGALLHYFPVLPIPPVRSASMSPLSATPYSTKTA